MTDHIGRLYLGLLPIVIVAPFVFFGILAWIIGPVVFLAYLGVLVLAYCLGTVMEL